MASDPKKAPAAKKAITQEQIVAGFNQLRQEQRTISGQVVELESDANEHGLVIEALKGVDDDRKCFRLVGGVLVEKTVKEILPSLEQNKSMISKLIETKKEQVIAKGKEIQEYMEKFNIQIRGQESSEETQDKTESSQAASSGVLVQN